MQITASLSTLPAGEPLCVVAAYFLTSLLPSSCVEQHMQLPNNLCVQSDGVYIRVLALGMLGLLLLGGMQSNSVRSSETVASWPSAAAWCPANFVHSKRADGHLNTSPCCRFSFGVPALACLLGTFAVLVVVDVYYAPASGIRTFTTQ